MRQLLDVAAELCVRHIRQRTRLKVRALAQDEPEAANADAEDGEATADLLRSAIARHGSRGHVAARAQLGDDLYDAIKGLQGGASWAWLCGQPALELQRIADRLDRLRGRNPRQGTRRWSAGGTHCRDQTPGGRLPFVPPDKVAEVILPLVRGSGLVLPVHELSAHRLTVPDWNRVIGACVKKVEKELVSRKGFGRYVLACVRGHEANHMVRAKA